jgi:AbrB family looped-hinge helix DNA binding protein
MQTTLLSSKGQIIIPKALRDARRWQAGTRLEVLETTDGMLLRPAMQGPKTALTTGLAAIRKRIAYPGPAISLEAMDAAVLREASLSMVPPQSTSEQP